MGTISLFSVALPMMLESVLALFINLASTAVLSDFSDSAVAAVGTVGTITTALSLILSVISIGATVVVSNYIGAEDKKGMLESSFVAVVTAVFIGALLSIVLSLFGGNILKLMNISGEIYNQAVLYFRIIAAFYAFNGLSSGLSALIQCNGYAKQVVMSSIAVSICTVLMNAYVIYINKNPAIEGVAGIAWSTVIGVILGVIIKIIFFKKLKINVSIPKTIKEFFKYMGKIFKIGLPSGLSSGSFAFSKVFTTSFIALIGNYALSANIYFSNILRFTYIFSISLGSSNALLVGRLCGAKRFEHADKLNRTLVKITSAVNLSICLIILIFRKPIVGIFTSDARIIDLALGIMLVNIITEQARAVSQIYEYGLRAAGDVTFTMVVVIMSCWVFGVGAAYFLSIPCGLGLLGCWIATTADESVRALATYFRWQRGKWRHINIVK